MKTQGSATRARGGRNGWGERSPHVLPELFWLPTGKKSQGRGQGGSAANFFFSPRTEKCRRVGGERGPQVLLVGGGGGCRVTEKLRVDDREEALLIFYWASIFSHLNFTLTSLLSLPPHPPPPYQHPALCSV
jgi:hypothetical protein